jgi:hypothetical protein
VYVSIAGVRNVMLSHFASLKRFVRVRRALIPSRPVPYIAIIIAAALVGSIFMLRTNSIFSCQASGYSSDTYVAYCQATSYADYEHGAFWFGLESAEKFAAAADVLFVGDSRLQFAFSTTASDEWFSSASARHYLLGFSYRENMTFTGKLLHRIAPRPRVVIMNVDTLFERTETPPAKVVMRDPGAEDRYFAKRRWQPVHRAVCSRFARLCADRYVVFRSRSTGAYSFSGSGLAPGPVSYDDTPDVEEARALAESGKEFLASLPVERECMILTTIPSVRTKFGTAQAIANALGVTLVMPRLEGLQTFDGVHLDRSSADRWSDAFLQAAAMRVRNCLTSPGPLPSRPPAAGLRDLLAG